MRRSERLRKQQPPPPLLELRPSEVGDKFAPTTTSPSASSAVAIIFAILAASVGRALLSQQRRFSRMERDQVATFVADLSKESAAL